MQIGLFFGSFNPVHNGHLMIASYLCQTTPLQKVWLVVSPQNPFKQKDTLLNEYDRLHLIRLATDDNPQLQPSDVEFKLPRPSYTIDTLTYLTEKYPQHTFSLIMGSDNLASLHKWKNAELLLQRHHIYVYQRRGYTHNPYAHLSTVHWLDFPFIDISATFIRQQIRQGISMQYFLPDAVWRYIKEQNWYK